MFEIQLKKLVGPMASIPANTKVAETRIVCDEGETQFDFEFTGDSTNFRMDVPASGNRATIVAINTVANPDGITLGVKATGKNDSSKESAASTELLSASPFQSFFNKENTIYKITNDFDLDWKAIMIPKGCVLDFQGGSFKNGTIIFQDTTIRADKDGIFTDMYWDGQVTNPVNVNWFKTVSDDGTIDWSSILYYVFRMDMGVITGNNTIYFPEGIYELGEHTQIVVPVGDSIIGAGAGTTQIKINSTSEYPVSLGAVYSGDKFYYNSIKDFSPDSDNTGQYTTKRLPGIIEVSGIEFNVESAAAILVAQTDYKISQCVFSDETVGISLLLQEMDGSQGTISDCIFNGGGTPITYGYLLSPKDSSRNSLLTGCKFSKVNSIGVHVASTKNLTISGCSFCDTKGSSLRIEDSSNVNIDGCSFSEGEDFTGTITSVIGIGASKGTINENLKISDCIINSPHATSCIGINLVGDGTINNPVIDNCSFIGSNNGILIDNKSGRVTVTKCLFKDLKSIPFRTQSPVVASDNIFNNVFTLGPVQGSAGCIVLDIEGISYSIITKNICIDFYPVVVFSKGLNYVSVGNLSGAYSVDTEVSSGVSGVFIQERVNSNSTSAKTNKGSTTYRPVLTANDKGWLYYDITLNQQLVWNGTEWEELGAGGEPIDLSDYVKMNPVSEQIIQQNIGLNTADSSVVNLYRNGEKQGEVGLVDSDQPSVGVKASTGGATLTVKQDGKCYANNKEIATIDQLGGSLIVYLDATGDNLAKNKAVYDAIVAGNYNGIIIDGGSGSLFLPAQAVVAPGVINFAINMNQISSTEMALMLGTITLDSAGNVTQSTASAETYTKTGLTDQFMGKKGTQNISTFLDFVTTSQGGTVSYNGKEIETVDGLELTNGVANATAYMALRNSNGKKKVVSVSTNGTITTRQTAVSVEYDSSTQKYAILYARIDNGEVKYTTAVFDLTSYTEVQL